MATSASGLDRQLSLPLLITPAGKGLTARQAPPRLRARDPAGRKIPRWNRVNRDDNLTPLRAGVRRPIGRDSSRHIKRRAWLNQYQAMRSSSSKRDCQRAHRTDGREQTQLGFPRRRSRFSPTSQTASLGRTDGRTVPELVCVCVCACVCVCVHNSRPAPDVKGRAATLQSDKLIRQVPTDANRATERPSRLVALV